MHRWLSIEPTEPFNEQFETLGFESLYILNNMGTMTAFYLCYPVLIIVYKVMKRCRNLCLCAKKTQTGLRALLYYKLVLTVMIESYSLIAICCFIGLPIVEFTSPGLALQSFICLVATIFIALVPYLLIVYLSKHFKLLGDDKMKKRHGALYEDLKLKRGKSILA